MLRSIVIAFLMIFSMSEACKCVPKQPYGYYYCSYPIAMRAKIDRETPLPPLRVVYDIEIKAMYKNESTGDLPLKMFTAKDSAACGVKLEVGEEYLIFASFSDPQGYSVNSCSFPTKWADVPSETKRKLESGQMASDPCPTPDMGGR